MNDKLDLQNQWTLHFDRDGTEDIAVIRDEDEEELIQSRGFWLPEGDDPVPPTLAAVRMMVAAPELLEALRRAHDRGYFDEHQDDSPEEADEKIRARAAITRAAVTP